MKNLSSENFAKKLLIGLIGFFSVCCLKLCAEEVVISPAQAQVQRENFIAEAKKCVGAPYVYGAVGPDSFDCSGLVFYVAKTAVGKQLPRTAKAIYNYVKIIPDKDKEIGDLLFFKTTDSGSISHVGIYIGNQQFISAISDGPNTGVIISSLNQDYWKGKYVAVGQFIKSGKTTEEYDEPYVETETAKVNEENPSVNKTNKISEKPVNNSEIASNVLIDTSAFCNWSLISLNKFMITFRGADIQTNVRYAGWKLQPGLGIGLRYNAGLCMFQMPILVTSTVNDFLRIYAGPVVSFSEGTLFDTEKTIRGSFFPGILGFSISTPSINIRNTKLQFVQDLSYTTFNNEDDSALNFLESISAGIILHSGLRLTVPVSAF